MQSRGLLPEHSYPNLIFPLILAPAMGPIQTLAPNPAGHPILAPFPNFKIYLSNCLPPSSLFPRRHDVNDIGVIIVGVGVSVCVGCNIQICLNYIFHYKRFVGFPDIAW